jgi:plastocyanin
MILKPVFLIAIVSVAMIGVMVPSVFAESTHIVETAMGSGAPGCETSNACYLPADITISTGDTVQWDNVDNAAHTVTGGSPSDGPSGVFDSSLLMVGSSYSHIFDDAGSYDYFCMVHPWMTGSVTLSKPVTIELDYIHISEISERSAPLEIASFVDQTKDPQHYIDRYNNEPAYKQWFDENYPQYSSIHAAVGMEDSITKFIEEPIVESAPLRLAPFIELSKDPQHYIDRYNNEPAYKQWFDENYPQYSSIHAAVRLVETNQEYNTTFTVTNYQSYLDGVKNMHEVLQESIDIEYQNLHEGKTSPMVYIAIAEVMSTQVTATISEFVTSRPSEQWQESYISHMNGMKKFNEYIIETKVLANQIENGSLDAEILETIDKIESIKAESIVYFTNSEKLRPQIPVTIVPEPVEEYTAEPITEVVSAPICGTGTYQKDGIEYTVDFPCDVVESKNETSNNLEKLIPDGYNIEPGYNLFDVSSIDGNVISATSIRNGSIEQGLFILIQSNDQDKLWDGFKMFKGNLQYLENVTDLSATCVEGWMSNGAVKVMVCLKDDMIIIIADNFGETKLAMKQTLSTIGNSNGGGCLIATATYGSEMAIEVQQLRELRDNQLLNTESGTAFMGMFNDIYYSFSPIIADYERENPLFKEAVKIAITPMISSLSLMENANSESEVLGMGLSVIMLNLGMYLGVPAVLIVGIRKRI